MDHLGRIRERIRTMPISQPMSSWKTVATYAIGGLTEVGFADDSDLLMIVSYQGRGVVDCRTGERISRDRTEPDDTWYNERRLRALGIGPLVNQTIRLAGLHGGGLPNSGRDGWWVNAVTLEWPDVHLLLGGPRGWIYDGTTPFLKLAVERQIRAFGFSDTGESLVIATSSDVQIIRWST